MNRSTSEDITLQLYLGPDGRRPGLKTVSSDGGWRLMKSQSRNYGRIPVVSYEVSSIFTILLQYETDR